MYLKDLKKEDVFVSNEMKTFNSISELNSRKGLENVIISNGKVVNVVSNQYGHISNQLFFNSALEEFRKSNIAFEMQTINRDDRSFVMDLIITDKSHFKVKNNKDVILPMLRFVNSYDGKNKTAAHIGFYREICSNGLHVANTKIEFSVRRSKRNIQMIMPNLKNLVTKFRNNEYYEILEKFDQLKEIKILDNAEFVKKIIEKSSLFRFDKSDVNPDLSKKSNMVIDILNNEAILLGETPNLWLGYNAFNEYIFNHTKKSFSQQERLDKKIFESVLELA